MSVVINPSNQDIAGLSPFSNSVATGAVIGSIVGRSATSTDQAANFLADFFVMSSGFGVGFAIGTAIDRAFGVSDAVANWLGNVGPDADYIVQSLDEMPIFINPFLYGTYSFMDHIFGRSDKLVTGFGQVPVICASGVFYAESEAAAHLEEPVGPSWKDHDIFPSVTQAGADWLVDHYEPCELDDLDCVLGTVAASTTIPVDIADDILWSLISIF